MKKINHFLAIFLVISIAFVSCNKDDDTPRRFIDTTKIDNPINHFVWRAMNSWYNWQPDVADLADTKDDNLENYYTFLNSYSKPESLFNDLCFEYYKIVGSENATDRYSWFVEDYKKQDASFRGVNDAYGFEFGVATLCEDCPEVIGFVTYVVPNSPAADAGILRGDLFYKFDGVELNLDNYRVVNNFYDGEITNISLEFCTIDNGAIVPNNIEKALTIRQVTENPVYFSDIITNSTGTKIGYFVYNSFKYPYHEELNNVFANFKAEGITELVLDLRYNGGGSVLTSAYLASMIYGAASENEVFAKLIYNSKHSDESGLYPFFNTAYIYDKEGDYTGSDATINRLNSLTRLYVITSSSTASASEMIINGLAPYMSVIKIGTKTYGKNVGSITLYDSPDFEEKNINPQHTNAVQPIVFQIYNKLDESDYIQGFKPDYEVFEYASQIKQFGDIEEPLLKTALDLISGASKPSLAKENMFKSGKSIFNSLDKKKYSKEMYIIPE